MSNQPLQPPLIRTLSRLRAAFWRRRVVLGLVRAGWLALLVPVVVLAGYLWLDWQTPWYIWVGGMVGLGLLSLLWSLRPLRLKSMSRRLDDLLGLRAQLVTALEISQTADSNNPVTGRLLQETVGVAVELRRQIAVLGRGFWVEMNALIAVAAMLAALLVFDALSPNIPNATAIELPPAGQEPSAEEVIPPDARLFPPPFQQQLQTLSQAQLQAALEALAEALRDQAVTRAAAEALDQGDLGGAAEALRRLADQLEGLSEEAQQELGESLQEGADNVGQNAPGLSQPLQQGSDALEQGNLEQAAQALEELAEALDAIEQSQQEQNQPQAGNEGNQDEGEGQPGEPADESQAQEGESQEPGDESQAGSGAGEGEGGDGEQPLAEEEERLPIDGQPLELESDPELEDRVLQPSELEAEDDGRQTSNQPFARQPLNAAGDELGPDPLSYPWEKREIVRRYFTPQ